MIKFETNSPEETFQLGKKIGRNLTHGGIVCLQGDLGAGKTVLAKGICRGLGVEEEITSPTYTVVNEYRGELKVYHMDLYRIRSEEELYDIGFEDYLYSGEGVTIIEWPDKAGTLMPDNYLDINLRGEGNWREIRIIPQANKFIELVAGLK
ncbi:tRNA (adenosine(37)-N6)-threonylcarbamoyltransferase complex ATPase subunit type 1 TsaE [Natroniella sulfidigena]|uniref:tRNA (adenosine(37)-N6)-threonylcarbamoyltransferase complex ATPase subunit type 1 TsaE n=1 Tax=Natroniella sulfidigena TaxID=723921 RepID=UPI00200B0EDC|nr:tRNA (adenosine(37)-N6)-threonylcarbamoyltransferase complex ATPase subunit type 1 TsaE [Natroniella sulfidigena]MCK8816136.1 tRNA (adenosine(37)-N6)-threonylcarbamoyltransferase complex ATPase subunit type 1 TsaE [Natroniella sulfidigena]